MIILKANFPEEFKAVSDEIIDKLKANLNENGELPVFDVKEVKEDIKGKVKESLDESEKTVLIGYDHLTTKDSFSAFSESFENAGLVLFDAHPHTADFVKELIEEGKLKKENLLIIGLRSWNKDEYSYLKQNNMKLYSMSEICNEGVHEICDSIMSVARNFDGLYISIDLDVVDAAFAPATRFNEPGGLSSREIIYFLQRLKLLKNLRFVDIMEFEQKKDINDMTALLCAKIVREVC